MPDKFSFVSWYVFLFLSFFNCFSLPLIVMCCCGFCIIEMPFFSQKVRLFISLQCTKLIVQISTNPLMILTEIIYSVNVILCHIDSPKWWKVYNLLLAVAFNWKLWSLTSSVMLRTKMMGRARNFVSGWNIDCVGVRHVNLLFCEAAVECATFTLQT